jgi:hypothetical protein
MKLVWLKEKENSFNNALFSATIELLLIQSFDTFTGNVILSGGSPMGALSR